RQFHNFGRPGAWPGLRAVGWRITDRQIRMARFLRSSRTSQLVLADPLAYLDASSKSRHSSGQNRRAKLRSHPAAAFRMGHDLRPIWLQLRELFPAHLV